MTYETVIGLEVHIELKTESKMFCRCRNVSLCEEPNRHICPVCMGLVGALPLINRKAVEYAILTGLALDCQIASHSKWDRKNYFYPDLPKAYQISQYDLPLSFNGKLELLNRSGETFTVRINRVHLEEDAAKLIHHGKETWVDFNRSSLPLIEIVTEADLRSIEDAEALLKELRRVVRYIGVSDADMEKGQLRCDASISLRPMGEDKLYPRVEIKNLNSFKMVAKALSYEKDRLLKLWEASTPPEEASTVLWDEEKEETRFMRDKESAADYRYVPEPDVPEVSIAAEWVEDLKKSIPVLPSKCMKLFLSHEIDLVRAESLVEDRESAQLLCELIALAGEAAELRTLVIKKFLGGVGNATANEFFALVQALHKGDISGLQYRNILDSDDIRTELQSAIKGSASLDLEPILNQVLSENLEVVEEYKLGKEKAINVLVGKVIQKTNGAIPAPQILETLRKLLSE